MKHMSQSCSRATPLYRPRSYRPQLETLEGRFYPGDTVLGWTLLGSGLLSLSRDAVPAQTDAGSNRVAVAMDPSRVAILPEPGPARAPRGDEHHSLRDVMAGSASGNAVAPSSVANAQMLFPSWAWEGLVDPFAEPWQNPWDKPAKAPRRGLGSEQGEFGSAHGGAEAAPLAAAAGADSGTATAASSAAATIFQDSRSATLAAGFGPVTSASLASLSAASPSQAQRPAAISAAARAETGSSAPPTSLLPPPKSEGEADERVPNTDAKQQYPLWTTSVEVGGMWNGRLGVDGLGTVHVVGLAPASASPGAATHVYYWNNKFETRDSAGGFSLRYDVSGTNTMVVDPPGIAAEPDGTVHVVWSEQTVNIEGIAGYSLRYRMRDSSAHWGKIETLEDGSASNNGTGTYSYTQYREPVIGVSSAGVVHVACRRVSLAYTNSVFISGSEDIRQSASPNLGKFSAVEENTPSSAYGLFVLEGPYHLQVVASGDGTDFTSGDGTYFNWRRYTSGQPYTRFYAAGSITDPTTGNAYGGFLGFAASPSGAVHFAYVDNNFKVHYKAPGESWEIPQDKVRGELTGSYPQVLLDSRGQPIVAADYFAVKVNKVGGTQLWGFGNGSSSLAMVIDSFDVVHKLQDSSYLRTYTPNLATQDSYTMFDAGPAMSVNVANGNLFGSFPLFASQGAGLAAAVTLYYNSFETQSYTMGRGWSHSYDITLDDSTLRLGDGRRVVLGENFLDPNFDFLAQIEPPDPGAPGLKTVRTKTGTRYIFLPNGKLDRIKDANDNQLELFYKDDLPTDKKKEGKGPLQKVKNSMGRETTFAYAQGLLETVTDPGNRQYKLQYSGTQLIRISRDAQGFNQKWEFDYHTEDEPSSFPKKGRLKELRTPGEVAASSDGVKYEYYPDGRLRATTDPAEDMVASDININATESPVSDAKRLITYEDSRPTLVDSQQTFVISPRALVKDRRGNTTAVEYGYVMNVATKVTDPDGQFVTRAFGEYRSLLWFRDQRGSVTKYTYSFGGHNPPPGAEGGWNGIPISYPANLKKIYRPKKTNADPQNLNKFLKDAGNFLSPILYQYSTDSNAGSNDLPKWIKVTDAKGATTEYIFGLFPNIDRSTGNLSSIKYPPTTLVDISVERASEAFVYTDMGRLEGHYDAENGVTFYLYLNSPTGLVTTIQRDGQSYANGEHFTYDEMGNLETHTSAKTSNYQPGGTTTHSYDTLHRLRSVRDPLGYETVYEYDEDSNVKKVTNGRGFKTTYLYDKRDLLKSTTSAADTDAASTVSYQYDREGSVRRRTNGRGFATLTLYDTLGRVKEERQPGGGTTPGGGSPATHITQYEYYENGQLKKVTSKGGTSSPDRVTWYEYDPRNNRTAVHYPQVSGTATDPPQNNVDLMWYDDNDNLIATDRFENTTFQGGSAADFDERNRVRKSFQLTVPYPTADDPTASYLYDKNSHVVQVWNPDGSPTAGSAHSTSYVYNKRQELSQIKDGSGTVVNEFEYYEDGSRALVRGQKPLVGGLIPVHAFTYTERGQLKEDFDRLGNNTSFRYDGNGNLVSREDPLGKVVNYLYDSADRLTLEDYYNITLDIEVAHTYDANSNRTSTKVFNPQTGANDAVYAFDYDQADRLERLTYPNPSHYELWTYNEHGELYTHRDANGRIQTNTYDEMGRLITEVHEVQGAPFNVTISRSYDGASNLKQISDGTTAIVYRYGDDNLNRLQHATWIVDSYPPYTKSIDYGYYPSGNRKWMLDPQAELYTYTYDESDRLKTVTGDAGTFATYEYDDGGREKKVTLKNGVTTEYAYTDRDEIQQVRTKNSGGTVLASFSYQYNDRGERVHVTREHLGEQITYGYDDAGRLISEVSTGSGSGSPVVVPARNVSWAYDRAGNRQTQTVDGQATTYHHDSESRLTSEDTPLGTISYGYDNNGNQTSRSSPGGISENFDYDYANRLTYYHKMGSDSDTNTYTYAYAPTGDRLNKHATWQDGVPVNTTAWYMYDGHNVVTDYQQADGGSIDLQTSYVAALGIDSNVAHISADGTEHYYVTDGQGSVAGLSDSSGLLSNVEVTDAWGNIVAAGNDPVKDRYGFTGREKDSESGLMDYRARSYDPRTGRFLQKDPVLNTQPYSYASNNPVSRVDPMGLQDDDGAATSGLEAVRRWTASKAGQWFGGGWFGQTISALGSLGVDAVELSPLAKAVDWVTNPVGQVKKVWNGTVGALERESDRLVKVADFVTKRGGMTDNEAILFVVGTLAADATGVTGMYEGAYGDDTDYFLNTGHSRLLSWDERAQRFVGGVTQFAGTALMVESLFAGGTAKAGAEAEPAQLARGKLWHRQIERSLPEEMLTEKQVRITSIPDFQEYVPPRWLSRIQMDAFDATRGIQAEIKPISQISEGIEQLKRNEFVLKSEGVLRWGSTLEKKLILYDPATKQVRVVTVR